MDLMPLLGPRCAGPALGVPGAMTCPNWNAGMQCATAAAGMCGLQMSPASLDSSSLQITRPLVSTAQPPRIVPKPDRNPSHVAKAYASDSRSWSNGRESRGAAEAGLQEEASHICWLTWACCCPRSGRIPGTPEKACRAGPRLG